MYTVIDLFAGAGGLSLGFQQTGRYDIKVAFENNPVMQETYKRNHPRVDVRGDVCSADYSEIQKKYGTIDIVIGGPPCQGFSNANRQRNHIISQNNSLVKQYIRAILELRPKAFVMENVSMLRSEVHRFYMSKKDQAQLQNVKLTVKTSQLRLLDKEFMFEGVDKIVSDPKMVERFLWPEDDYVELNVVYKTAQNSSKLLKALEKHKPHLIKLTESHASDMEENRITRAGKQALSAIQAYYDGKLDAGHLRHEIEPAIMYQRMLSYAKEILDNDLVVDGYPVDDGLTATIHSFAVFDYLKALLGNGEGSGGYAISDGVLCAADFGAPQKRMRFIVMGIRKDISSEVKMPQGNHHGKPYATVHDAISDLEKIEPVVDIADDKGKTVLPAENLSELAQSLRNAPVLMNHIITKTTDTAMQRFKALQQGQNFHALDEKMKTNTYTDASRTQNTIYLRLDYSQPCGTVVNVRKSMWIHPTLDRAISIREAARLQTFPDSFVFCGSKDKQYQQVGNAVPPIMAKSIARKLVRQLEKLEDVK